MISISIQTPKGRTYDFALTTSKMPQVCVECGDEIPPKTEHYRKFFMVHVESEEYEGLSRRWDGKRLCQSCTPPEGCVIVRRWEA